HPLPNPPHKGGGCESSKWQVTAKSTGRHLPPCGGGWEWGEQNATIHRRNTTQKCRPAANRAAGRMLQSVETVFSSPTMAVTADLYWAMASSGDNSPETTLSVMRWISAETLL